MWILGEFCYPRLGIMPKYQLSTPISSVILLKIHAFEAPSSYDLAIAALLAARKLLHKVPQNSDISCNIRHIFVQRYGWHVEIAFSDTSSTDRTSYRYRQTRTFAECLTAEHRPIGGINAKRRQAKSSYGMIRQRIISPIYAETCASPVPYYLFILPRDHFFDMACSARVKRAAEN